MFETLFLIFTYFTEALIVYNFAKSIYEVKINKYMTFSIVCIVYFLLMIVYEYIINIDWFNIISVIVVNIIILALLFKSSWKSAFFHGVALGILQLVSEFLTAYITAIIFNTTSQDIIDQHFEIGVIMSRLLYYLFSILLAKVSSKETSAKSWGRWAILSLLPLSSLFVVHMFKATTSNINLSSKQYISSITAISTLFIVNIIVYMVYERAEKNNQKLIELELTNQKNEIDMQYLSLLEKKNEKMQIMAHDYKNHIQTIDAMSDSAEMKQYLQNMLGEVTEYSSVIKTKNKILDVIISKYSDLCSDKDIKFDTEIISENLSFIQGNELSSLLNNILDNAVEAAERSKKKYINMQISRSMGAYCKIVVTNSCDHELNTKNGKLLSTKKNREVHGYGTKSIERVVDKYNGEIKWNYDKDKQEFKLIIIIPEN